MPSSSTHPKELPRQRRLASDRFVNPLRLPVEIRIDLADDDAGMVWLLLMKTDEVKAIECEHGSILLRGKVQYIPIGQSLVGLTSFLNGQHIVTKPAQLLDDRQWEVLVGIKPGHQSASFSSIWRVISSP